ncbi:hypothetical protein DV515_00013959 [Chloebia gouldiae]|uniref:Uncharacterized protein n=1 Tax=Chloebia gouldiae TaxID=44316 RepID=A0A3L8RZF8_CHLGU|nr:hypothetical protein DV515_00013959 [Chloebia gouldiae]
MVVDWEQETGLLMTSGDVRIIRIWDTDREMKVQDIPTGADSCVTSLSCDSHRSLIVAGLGDGSIRVFDRRMALSECRVMTYREHTAWVLKAYLQKHPEGNIMSVRYRDCSPGAACHAHSLIFPPNSGPALVFQQSSGSVERRQKGCGALLRRLLVWFGAEQGAGITRCEGKGGEQELAVDYLGGVGRVSLPTSPWGHLGDSKRRKVDGASGRHVPGQDSCAIP